jgi:predicted O-methyltransferase YrrM
VVTVEVSEVKANMARNNIERAGLSLWVHQQVFDAGEFLRQQPPSQYELVLLDSNREQYLDWWPWIQAVLSPGGLLVVDNAISHAAEMKEFTAQVQTAAGWGAIILPIGSGELVALKPVAYGTS